MKGAPVFSGGLRSIMFLEAASSCQLEVATLGASRLSRRLGSFFGSSLGLWAARTRAFKVISQLP